MSLRETLSTPPDEWNHPRRPRVGMPVGGAVGALSGATAGNAVAGTPGPALRAGAGAALGVLLAWVGTAALD
jgi:hypothetical protein